MIFAAVMASAYTRGGGGEGFTVANDPPGSFKFPFFENQQHASDPIGRFPDDPVYVSSQYARFVQLPTDNFASTPSTRANVAMIVASESARPCGPQGIKSRWSTTWFFPWFRLCDDVLRNVLINPVS